MDYTTVTSYTSRRCRTAESFRRDGGNWPDACLIHLSIRVHPGKWVGLS